MPSRPATGMTRIAVTIGALEGAVCEFVLDILVSGLCYQLSYNIGLSIAIGFVDCNLCLTI
jgi:hypothetical protein